MTATTTPIPTRWSWPYGPRFGAYLVAAWRTGIIVNLLFIDDHHDVALCDFALPGLASHPSVGRA